MADRISHMPMHRMKSMAIKTKEEMLSERRRDTESASSRFSRAMERGAAYGAEETINAGSSVVERAYRKYGEKKLRARDQRIKQIEREVMRNDAEVRGGSRVRFASMSNEMKATENAKNLSARNLRYSPKSANLNKQIYTKQKNYTILKLRRKEAFGGKRRKVANSGKAARNTVKGIKGVATAVKTAAVTTKSIASAIAAAGSSAILIIVICIFLSASVYLFGQDTSDEYSAEALGVGDTLIMRVASAQLGNVGGKKFWSWYGFEGRVEWCAIFVSWCGNQCGYIDKGIIPRFAVVGDGVDWFKARGRFRNNRYIPHPGDIIFFDWEADGTRDHVGFVERCDGKTVYTIEGNSGDTCRRLAYRVGHPEVLGYACPDYPLPQSSTKTTKSESKDKPKTDTRPNIR